MKYAFSCIAEKKQKNAIRVQRREQRTKTNKLCFPPLTTTPVREDLQMLVQYVETKSETSCFYRHRSELFSK